MSRNRSLSQHAEGAGGSQGEYWELSRRFFSRAALGKPIREYISEVGQDILAFTACDEVEIWLHNRQEDLRLVCGRDSNPPPRFLPWTSSSTTPFGLEALCRDLVDRRLIESSPPFTERGSLFVEDCSHPVRIDSAEAERVYDLTGPFGSLLLLPFDSHPGGDTGRRLVVLKVGQSHGFRSDQVHLLEEVTQDLALSVTDRRTHASLRERMKELTCLYRIALLKEEPAASVEEVLQGIVGVLPEAWLYPADAWVRLEVDGSTYAAGAIPPRGPSLQAQIKVAGALQGLLEVGYSGDKPPLDTGPFLQEEQKLLETVAREIALVLERREVAEQSRELEEQFRHAERLATVGELAAGIAHELNDPLNNILGFAQLIEDSEELTEQARRDVSMIVTSALHTREVIRQLLLFARRTLQTGTSLDLSHLVQESFAFLQAICAKTDIELVHHLATDLPPIWANPDQLRQVLVNLVVNASQAMPLGGRVTISTDEPDGEEGIIRLTVGDTGVGMSEEVIAKAFLPFFTTREGGTGLGLSAVHGVVTSHQGSVRVESDGRNGTRFEVRFPVSQS